MIDSMITVPVTASPGVNVTQPRDTQGSCRYIACQNFGKTSLGEDGPGRTGVSRGMIRASRARPSDKGSESRHCSQYFRPLGPHCSTTVRSAGLGTGTVPGDVTYRDGASRVSCPACDSTGGGGIVWHCDRTQ
eukprot:768497-Hanusia_phi.AAC.1